MLQFELSKLKEDGVNVNWPAGVVVKFIVTVLLGWSVRAKPKISLAPPSVTDSAPPP